MDTSLQEKLLRCSVEDSPERGSEPTPDRAVSTRGDDFGLLAICMDGFGREC